MHPSALEAPAGGDNVLARLQADVTHTIFVRRLTLLGYFLAVPLLRGIGVPIDDQVVATLALWFVSTFGFAAVMARARTEPNAQHLHTAYLLGEVSLMLYVVHNIGGVAWVGVFFPTFTIYYACTLLPRRYAVLVTVAAGLGFCALALAEAAGTIPHLPLFPSSADNYRDAGYLIGTLLLTAIGGYGLLGFTFERFGRMQHATAAAERVRRGQAESLLVVSEALSAGSDPPALLRVVARAMLAGLAVDRTGAWLLDEQTNTAQRVACFSAPGLPETPVPEHLSTTNPLVAHLLREGTALQLHADDTGPTANLARDAGVRSLLVVPFGNQGRVLGAITAATVVHAHAWSTDDMATVGAVAAQAAAALERARVTTLTAEATALRQLDEWKSDFFRTVGHEMRRPLTVTMGYLDLIVRFPDRYSGDRLRGMLTEAQASTRELARQIEDLMDLAQADAGSLRLNCLPLDPALVVRALGTSYQSLPGGERIQVDVPDTLPLVIADEVRLRQVLGNLLANALHYAPEGAIVLHAAATADQVEVRVKDHGPGIALADQERIWDRYYRATTAKRLAPHGSGLGLAVVKTLVEAQGGQIAVQTGPEGSEFTLRLPISTSAPPPEPPLGRPSPR